MHLGIWRSRSMCLYKSSLETRRLELGHHLSSFLENSPAVVKPGSLLASNNIRSRTSLHPRYSSPSIHHQQIFGHILPLHSSNTTSHPKIGFQTKPPRSFTHTRRTANLQTPPLQDAAFCAPLRSPQAISEERLANLRPFPAFSRQ